jgi:hypothetical protein
MGMLIAFVPPPTFHISSTVLSDKVKTPLHH